MIRFRNVCKAFEEGAEISVEEEDGVLRITWKKDTCSAALLVDFVRERYEIKENGIIISSFSGRDEL